MDSLSVLPARGYLSQDLSATEACRTYPSLHRERKVKQMKDFSIQPPRQLSVERGFRVSHLLRRSPTSVYLLTALLLFTVILFSATATSPDPAAASDMNSLSPSRQEKPQPGWLYVVDSNNQATESQILLVNPEQGSVVRSFKAFYNPDIALSPDGTRLYLASTQSTGQILEVIDTTSGATLLTIPNPERWRPSTPYYRSHMAFSPDGNWLYVYKHEYVTDLYYVATFDVRQNQFLPEKAYLPDCINAVLAPTAVPLALNVLCTGSNDVRFLKITKRGGAAISRVPVQLRKSRHGLGVYLGVISPNDSTINVIAGDGLFSHIDTKLKKITHTGEVDSRGRKKDSTDLPPLLVQSPDDWMGGKWIPLQASTSTPGESKLYVGIGQLADFRRSNWSFSQIAVFDKNTLDRVGTFEPSRQVFSLTLSKDGKRLYGIDPRTASIVIIDTATDSELRTISGLGVSPIIALVAP
jgi:DNA-binding beta-propeller fold protein YncE